jgi:octaheme c-type cytochrome (tetrathionate reductase family)
MTKRHALLALGPVLVISAVLLFIVGPVGAQDSMDHSVFPQLEGPFETGSDVTQACLTCHAGESAEVMATEHWTWESTHEITGEAVGKINIVNNYCVTVKPNWPRCTSCHAGYGWANDDFDFTAEENVDCLVCHESTGTYKKFPTAAGEPVYGETRSFGGKEWPAPDLAAAAQSVGPPSRANCGACHFTGGGGDAVKHGDMDTSLANPDFALDVHMDAEGLNFSCQACHATTDHDIPGGRYVSDYYDDGPARCETCHTEAPHGDATIDYHTATIACQTCHIPEYARAQPTKMTWDWTTAGDRNEDGSIKIITDEATGKPIYDSRKGAFTWEQDVVPTYRFFNGVTDWTLLDETIDPEVGFMVNSPNGSVGDGKIWPFKLFTGTSFYDSVNMTPAALDLFPLSAEDPTAFWRNWDFALAIQGGMEAYGVEYSGEYGFVDNEMWWPITHMVAPASESLTCTDCHGDAGRLDYVALGFDETRAAELAKFPPGPEETTTTTAAPTTTEATTTTAAPTTTAASTTTILAEGADDDGGSNLGIVLGLVLLGALLIGGGTFYFMRRSNA